MEDYLESAYKCTHCSGRIFVKFPDDGPAYKIVRCPNCLGWLIATCVNIDDVEVALMTTATRDEND